MSSTVIGPLTVTRQDDMVILARTDGHGDRITISRQTWLEFLAGAQTGDFDDEG